MCRTKRELRFLCFLLVLGTISTVSGQDEPYDFVAVGTNVLYVTDDHQDLRDDMSLELWELPPGEVGMVGTGSFPLTGHSVEIYDWGVPDELEAMVLDVETGAVTSHLVANPRFESTRIDGSIVQVLDRSTGEYVLATFNPDDLGFLGITAFAISGNLVEIQNFSGTGELEVAITDVATGVTHVQPLSGGTFEAKTRRGKKTPQVAANDKLTVEVCLKSGRISSPIIDVKIGGATVSPTRVKITGNQPTIGKPLKCITIEITGPIDAGKTIEVSGSTASDRSGSKPHLGTIKF